MLDCPTKVFCGHCKLIIASLSETKYRRKCACAQKVTLMLAYKIIETTEVTADKLEELVNEWALEGWELDGFQFVTPHDAVRPAMAFVIFSTQVFEEEVFLEEDENNSEKSESN